MNWILNSTCNTAAAKWIDRYALVLLLLDRVVSRCRHLTMLPNANQAIVLCSISSLQSGMGMWNVSCILLTANSKQKCQPSFYSCAFPTTTPLLLWHHQHHLIGGGGGRDNNNTMPTHPTFLGRTIYANKQHSFQGVYVCTRYLHLPINTTEEEDGSLLSLQ